MFSKIMLAEPNMLLMDEPTDHLDLEAITALNQGLEQYPGNLILVSHDFQLLESVANRVIEVGPNGMIDRPYTFSEYMENGKVKALRESL
jgi:ATPase subunit of ABC transporter with duplicated ATPase domains